MTAMIAHSTRPPLLGALVRQLMQLDVRPSAQMTERRRQRIETMLALLLEHGGESPKRTAEGWWSLTAEEIRKGAPE